jgi:hypothetical protein
VSLPDEMPDDSTLERIAAGDGSMSEDVTYAGILAAEVLRLRERVARADRDAAGYLADHAAALLDLGAATSRAEKAEGERDALRVAARSYRQACDSLAILEDDARDVPLQARLMREAVADGWAPEEVRAHRESDLGVARCAVGDAATHLDDVLGEG